MWQYCLTAHLVLKINYMGVCFMFHIRQVEVHVDLSNGPLVQFPVHEGCRRSMLRQGIQIRGPRGYTETGARTFEAAPRPETQHTRWWGIMQACKGRWDCTEILYTQPDRYTGVQTGLAHAPCL